MKIDESYLVTLASVYAEAAFDFAFENQALEKWELMFVAAKNIIKNEIIMTLLHNVDYLDPDNLADMFILLGNHSFDCFFQNFIRVLTEYKRLSLLPLIFENFLVRCCRQASIIKVEIITARVLENDQLLNIVSIIKKKFLNNNKVNVVLKLNQAIIGGFCVRFNNTIIDGSISGRINQLRNNMLGIYSKEVN